MTAGIKDSGPGSADRPPTSDRTSPFDKNAMGNTTPNPDSKTQFGSSSAGGDASSKTGGQGEAWQKSGSQSEASPKTGSQGEAWQKSGSQHDASPKAGSPNEPSWKTGSQGGSGGGDIAGNSLNTMQGLAQTVRSQAGDLVTNIGQELSATAEANIASGANALRTFTKAMQTAAQELEPQSPMIAQRIRDAAGQVESFTDGISNRNLGELVRAATDLAKRRPTYFVAGAILGGFALARFIKSSNAQSASSESERLRYAGDGRRGGGHENVAYGVSSGTDNMSSSSNRGSSTHGGESGIPARREDVSYGVSGDKNVNPSSGRNEWAR